MMSDETKPEKDAESLNDNKADPVADHDAGGDDSANGDPISQLQDALAEKNDQLLRALAEIENTRRRAAKDVSDARSYAVTGFAREMLDVADNLTRALNALTPDLRAGMGEAGKTLLEGVEMTDKALRAALERQNVRPIAAKGAPFDPNLHQAVAQIPGDAPANTVLEVVQDGWTIGERTLRAAMVVVSTGAPAAAEAQQAAADIAGTGGSATSEKNLDTPGARIDKTI